MGIGSGLVPDRRKRRPWSQARSEGAHAALRARLVELGQLKVKEAICSRSPARRRAIRDRWYDVLSPGDRRHLDDLIRRDERVLESVASVITVVDGIARWGSRMGQVCGATISFCDRVLCLIGTGVCGSLGGVAVSLRGIHRHWGFLACIVDAVLMVAVVALVIGSIYFSWLAKLYAAAVALCAMTGVFVISEFATTQRGDESGWRARAWWARVILLVLLCLAAEPEMTLGSAGSPDVSVRLEWGLVPCPRVRDGLIKVSWDMEVHDVLRQTVPLPPRGWDRVCRVVTWFNLVTRG